jgi:hypothetical protein
MESDMKRIYQKLPVFILQEVITSLVVFYFNKRQPGKAKTKSYRSFTQFFLKRLESMSIPSEQVFSE